MRHETAPHRAAVPVVQFDESRGVLKIAPILHWSEAQLLRYTVENDVPVNPLMYDGYPSIGCGPCTKRVAPGDDPRAGRWAGLGKNECGLHT
jgi:phosphoadenosine phosphosulfate reductase